MLIAYHPNLQRDLDQDLRDEHARMRAINPDASESDSEPEVPEVPPPPPLGVARRAHMQKLVAKLTPHVCVPASVESGHEDLTHTCSCILHQFCVESGSQAQLRQVLASFRTMTTDLGAEAGVANFHATSSNLIPP
eukprot:12166514-Alexandrium_andersonii.AAC.1